MLESSLEFLRCVRCSSKLELNAFKLDEEIEEGIPSFTKNIRRLEYENRTSWCSALHSTRAHGIIGRLSGDPPEGR